MVPPVIVQIGRRWGQTGDSAQTPFSWVAKTPSQAGALLLLGTSRWLA